MVEGGRGVRKSEGSGDMVKAVVNKHMQSLDPPERLGESSRVAFPQAAREPK